MTDRQALLATIIAAPDDDLPRLVYADYLEEHGDAADRTRATFIRLQIEAEGLAEWDGRRAALEAAADRLAGGHHAAWTAGYPADELYDRAYCYTRGFVSFALLTAATIADPAFDSLLAAEPVDDYTLVRDEAPPPDRVAAWPHLPRVRRLSLGVGRGPAARAVLRSPLLTELRELTASSALGRGDARLLATDERFSGLARLDVSFCDLTDARVAAIARSPVLARLTAFDFGGNDRITRTALEAVAASPAAARHTELGAAAGSEPDSPAGPRAAELVARFPALTKLDLSGHLIGDTGAEVLARNPALAGCATWT